MPAEHTTDVGLTAKRVSDLTSPDAVAAFFAELGYDTNRRAALTPEAIGLSGDSAAAIKHIELLSEDSDGFLRVVFVHLRALTAKSRNDLARVLGKSNVDHLLVLTSDFSTLEFVLLDKRRREVRGPVKATTVQTVPLMIAVERKSAAANELKALRRFTWNKRDGLEQYDKLRSVFAAAAFTEEYFCNRALFADHYLMTRLPEDPAWQENPTQAFNAVRDLCNDAGGRWKEKGEQVVRTELYEPLFARLGFRATVNKQTGDGQTTPDYLLASNSGNGKTAAFVYAWDRWLDGPDHNLDQETPDENPGACVVSALGEGVADWIIVTNGRQWRLYSKGAHSRATNFYEVDLVEAIVASGDTDPNEAFRYWWLFFRSQAFEPQPDNQAGNWLDAIAEGSRDYAKALGERLKDRVFLKIFPMLAQGFLADRRGRLGIKKQLNDAELHDTYEATLTLLYRLLFLLYAEARDLLPIREAPYRDASLRKIKEEIADRGGIAESEVTDRLNKAYSASEHSLYDRLIRLCAAMDKGEPALNVPIYNGGLFVTSPDKDEVDGANRDQRIARFLAEHKVPDRHLAQAIDRLARDPDDKTYSLVAIDYKSLEVRHLGSIYEGLLEFKLKVADEDLTTHTEKKREKYIPLGKAKPKRGKAPIALVRKGEVYLSNDKAERKASGSYYTPDPIVEYIVEHTVGPVLDEKLEKLRAEFRKVRKTFDNELAKQKVPPPPAEVRSGQMTAREFAGQKTYEAHQLLVDELFDFRVLDPAMGSGHFLVEAVDFITDRLLAFLHQFPVNPVTFMLNRMRTNILAALDEQRVTVDPEKLTEVNLLKRHVLKRSIYGVDLNPMAVELAKVSLWLDAFTIGAPLSFLDHHLRCGNSLIGATFKDLRAATQEQLFPINYDSLLRAIHHVLHVNAMADATAAEVKQSATEYGQARDRLAGYQVVLDLLVAEHFGVPDAPELLSRGGSELQLNSRADFMQSLADLNELAVVEKVEAIAAQPHMRFFHWEVEFPEVFFGFEGGDIRQQHLKHKNELIVGSAGFDAIVGNPPYGPLENSIRPYVLSTQLSHGGKPEIYAYFLSASVSLTKKRGRISFITPNTWLTLHAFRLLRERLLTNVRFVRILDALGVFPDAWVNTVVVVLANATPVSGELAIVAIPPRLNNCKAQLEAISREVWQTKYTIDQRVWLEQHDSTITYTTDDRARVAIDHIRNRFIPVDDHFLVTTGYQVYHNTLHTPDQIRQRAFHTDSPDKRRSYKRCFGGTDVRRYGWSYSSEEYVLFGEHIYRTPELKFFEQPKVLVQEIVGRGRYKVSSAFVDQSIYYDKSCLGIICRNEPRIDDLLVLLTILNSMYATWYFLTAGNKSYGTGDFARLTKQDLAELLIPKFDSGSKDTSLIQRFEAALDNGSTSEALTVLDPLLDHSPFPITVQSCLAAAAKRIIAIELPRNDIKRAARSSLSPSAQTLQNLLDQIIFRMTGLPDEVVSQMSLS